MNNSAKYLWITFAALVIFAAGSIAKFYSGHLVNMVLVYVPFAWVLAHAYRTLRWRGVSLIALAATIGFVAEAISLHYFTIFGGHYKYGSGAKLFQVPLAVIIYWAIFIYIGQWFIKAFNQWLKVKPPNILWPAVATGLVVTAIDLVMDPVEVKAGTWTWLSEGPYFHIPIGNFVGWFGVTTFTALLYEKFIYKQTTNLADSFYLLPVASYLSLSVYFVLLALKYNLALLAVIGCFVTILPSLLNLFLYYRYKRVPGRQ